MRRFLALCAVLLALSLLAVTAYAVTGANNVDNHTTVASDGTCQVSLTVNIHLDSPVEHLRFPVPGNARNVLLSGVSASLRRNGSRQEVDLSRVIGAVAGDFQVLISYSLPNSVAYRDHDGDAETPDRLMLNIPLLSGFSYPVTGFAFSVTLPAEITTVPSFSSSYYLQAIESDVTYAVEGATLSGAVTKSLRDLESLTMTLEVSEEVFPQTHVRTWTVDMDDVAMYVCIGLAALYWLVFLRCLPVLRQRTTLPPEGLSAGELPCALTGQGLDLTALVLTWAQLGYILIQLDSTGRVLLHKRMEMGNERDDFECRCFRAIFGRRRMVEGTGVHYAQLSREMSNLAPHTRTYFQRGTGNPKLFRALAAAAGLFGGMSLGTPLGGEGLLGGLTGTLFGVLGCVCAWGIQGWAYCLHTRNRRPLVWAIAGCLMYLLLGFLASGVPLALGLMAWELMAGLAAAYGGRRSGLGRQIMAEILGLRHFLRRAAPQDLHRLRREDPDYFFSMAPYAVALGVDRAFATRFGKARLGACPYLTTGMDGHRTALEWDQLIRQVVSAMDARQRRLPYEQIAIRLPGPSPRRKRRRKL